MPARLTRGACALLLLTLSCACGNGPDGDALPWDSEPGSDAQLAFPSSDASVSESAVSTSTGSTASRPTGSTGTTSSTTSSSGTSGTSSSPSSGSSGSASARDAGTGASASRDAASAAGDNAIDDLIGGLFGSDDAGTKSSTGDASTSGDWKLEPDSAAECPPEPPPIPIVGGACLGLYYTCNWKNAAGETYFCTCDWVHWLCI